MPINQNSLPDQPTMPAMSELLHLYGAEAANDRLLSRTQRYLLVAKAR